MSRPVNYNTKHAEVILKYLIEMKNTYITAAEIIAYLKEKQVHISRPTVYRQLERYILEGKVKKYIFDGVSIACFQYIEASSYENDIYHLKCEICDKIYQMKCEEMKHISRHIYESHDFEVDNNKTIFYGRCQVCRQ